MSHVSVRPAPVAGRPRSIDDVIGVGLKLLSLSLDNVREVVRAIGPLLPAVPSFVAPRLPKCGCEIPEQDCPPRCVCEVNWEAAASETLKLTIRVTNASHSSRTFHLQPTSFEGAAGSAGTVILAPASLTLSSGQAGYAYAAYTVPKVADGKYHAEIVVRGAYEQSICVTLNVQCQKTCGEECPTCDVVQGEPPVRIRAHQWYHHFQCIEPCMAGERRPDN